MNDLLLIVNPNAGRNGFRDCLGDVLHTIHKCGWRTTVAFTNAHGDSPRIAAEEGIRYRRIVCMGGDGTLSETISGLMTLPAEKRPEIAYIPMGTSNRPSLSETPEVLSSRMKPAKRRGSPSTSGDSATGISPMSPRSARSPRSAIRRPRSRKTPSAGWPTPSTR